MSLFHRRTPGPDLLYPHHMVNPGLINMVGDANVSLTRPPTSLNNSLGYPAMWNVRSEAYDQPLKVRTLAYHPDPRSNYRNVQKHIQRHVGMDPHVVNREAKKLSEHVYWYRGGAADTSRLTNLIRLEDEFHRPAKAILDEQFPEAVCGSRTKKESM